MQKTLLNRSGAGHYPVFELSHTSCMTIRRLPMVVMSVRDASGNQLSRHLFDSLGDAAIYWNNNVNSL